MTLAATALALWSVPWLRVCAGLLLGVVFGSFVGAALLRLPRGGSALRGRSCCDGCGKTLSPGELVPLASFVLLRGRCRACGHPIDRWHLAAEAGGAALGAAAALLAATPAFFAVSLALGLQLLLLGLLDLRHFWLPDRLVLLLALSGLAAGLLHPATGTQWLYGPVLGGLLGFGLLWLAAVGYRRLRGHEGMGAGDPKLLGALGLWLGPVGVVLTLLGASLAGLVAAAAMAAGGRTIDARTALPLGTLMALAGWGVWLGSGGGQTWR